MPRTLAEDSVLYTDKNFKTKKSLKQAVENGEQISIYQPGPFGGGDYSNGKFCVEGPKFPEPHRWYASVIVKDGYITKVS